MTIDILLADDHAPFRKELRLLLEDEADFRVVEEAPTGQAAIEYIEALLPDVVVIDINMPDINGIDTVRHIARAFPETRVVVLSAHASGHLIRDIFKVGGRGYLLKKSAPEKLAAAIHAVIRGEVFLGKAIAGKIVDGCLDGEGPAQPNASDGRMAGSDAVIPYQARLIRTKLHRPMVPPLHVRRDHLFARMDSWRQGPVTLVSAPAGYGKSVLVSGWLERLDSPSAWLSLDKDDDAHRRFLTYFLAAVASIFPDAVPRTTSMACAIDLPPVKEVITSLINELERIGEDYILVLDDVHHLSNRSVLELLGSLLRYPPAHMHLVLIGRRDPFLPIGALRAQGRISEIRTVDLRFTPEETALFLRQEFGKKVDMSTAASWAEKSEGWCTGLRLAAMAIRSRGHEDIPDNLPGKVQYVLEYLFEEVLAGQPPEERRLLMDSAILDRFCAPLCEVLSDRENGVPSATTGWEFVRRLKAENLFLISLDEENRWFRYHHLFQRLLRNQLQRHRSPEHIATLHERAGDWFARNGMIDEAIQHALKAGSAPKALQLLGRHRHALFETGAWVVLEGWLERIPEALVDEHPDLLMAKAQLLFYQNRFHLLQAIVDRAESLLPADSAAAESILREIQFFRGVSHLMGGDGHLCMKSLETALPRIPATHQGFRGMALIVYGLACQMTGRQETVLTRLAGVLDDPLSNFEMQLRMIRGLLWVQLISGDLSAAETLVHQMRATAIGKQNLAHLTLSSHAFGLIQFHRCEFDAAIQNFKAAAEHGHLLMRRNRIDSMVGLALALQAKARWDEASGCMADLIEYAHATGDLTALAIAKSSQARLRCHSLEAGDPGFPEAIDGGGVSQNHAMLWWLEVPAITRCRVLLADGSEVCLGEAEKRLRCYLRQNQAQHNRCQAMDIMALLAVTVRRLGQPDEALKILDELVRLAEPGGWVRPFVEAGPPMPDLLEQLKATGVCVAFVERLLHTIAELEPTEERRGLQPASRPPNAQQPLIEPLTKREQDILELLARRWQNKEIAARLCVSPETVKSHLKNVYRKLDVRGRRQAVVKARELGILFPK